MKKWILFFTLFAMSSTSLLAQAPKLTTIAFTKEGLPTSQVSYGFVTVELVFDKAMDTNVNPTINFSLDQNYGLTFPAQGNWQSNTIWQGQASVTNIVPSTGDGEYLFRISGAKDGGGTEMDTTYSKNINNTTLFICRTGSASFNVDSLKFGNTLQGASQDLRLVIYNTSCAALVINSYSAPKPFSIVNTQFNTSIPANDSLVLTVRFQPTQRAGYVDSLVFNTNDRQQNTHYVYISGTGIGPNIVVSPPDTLDFGKVRLDSSATREVRIHNAPAGNAQLNANLIVSSISTPLENVFEFSQSNFIIAPGDTSPAVTATFTPAQAIDYTGTILSIVSNDSTKTPYRIYIKADANDETPPEPVNNLQAIWSGSNGFTRSDSLLICWDNPADASGIARISWKFVTSDAPPTSPNDTTNGGSAAPVLEEGRYCVYLPLIGRLTTSGRWNCYVWLTDGNGNSGYQTAVRTTFTYDVNPPSAPKLVSQSIPGDQWFDNSQVYQISISIPNDTQRGFPDAAEIRWKFKNPPSSATDFAGRTFFNAQQINAATVTIPFQSTSLCGDDSVYFWLADSAGNSNPQNYAFARYRFDICSPDPVANLQAVWSGSNGFTRSDSLLICWDDVSNPNGIAGVYWKFVTNNAPPTSANDTTNGGSIVPVLQNGRYCVYLPLRGRLNTSGRWNCYVWVRDGLGYSGYRNAVRTTFIYDINPPAAPVLTSQTIAGNVWFGSNAQYRLNISIPNDTQRGFPDASELRWKFKTPPTSATDFAGRTIFNAQQISSATVTIPFLSTSLCGSDSVFFWLADSAGNSDPKNVTFAPYSFDICPPQITRTGSDTVAAELGADFRETVVITDHVPVDTVWFEYRFGGAETSEPPRQLIRQANTDTFYVDLPAAGITRRGIEYRVIARDSLGNQGNGPTGDAQCSSDAWFPIATRVAGQGDFRIDTDGNAVPLISGTDSTTYQLISVPYQLDSSGVMQVLGDDLGVYDDNQWRLFDYNTATSQWLEGASARNFMPGRSFFVITRQENIVVDSGPGKTVKTVCSDSIRLYPGWNLIATPFNFPVAKDRLTLVNSNSQVTLRSYERGWNIVDIMEQWRGYAIYVTAVNSAAPIYLVVEPKASAGRREKVAAEEPLLSGEWMIRISAKAGKVDDKDNWLGVRTFASDGYDDLELAEPPVVGKFVSVAFPRADWSQPAKHFSTDFRATGAQEFVWEFTVETNQSYTDVDLNFDFIGEVPVGSELFLIDEAAGMAHDLNASRHYRFRSGKNGSHKTLKIVAGSQQFAQQQAGDIALVPGEFTLQQNYPNPFNPETTIRYNLPQTAEVTIAIYNQLGQKIRTLVNGQQQNAGYYSTVWNGRDDANRQVASGLYLYKITAGSQTLTRKMVLMK